MINDLVSTVASNPWGGLPYVERARIKLDRARIPGEFTDRDVSEPEDNNDYKLCGKIAHAVEPLIQAYLNASQYGFRSDWLTSELVTGGGLRRGAAVFITRLLLMAWSESMRLTSRALQIVYGNLLEEASNTKFGAYRTLVQEMEHLHRVYGSPVFDNAMHPWIALAPVTDADLLAVLNVVYKPNGVLLDYKSLPLELFGGIHSALISHSYGSHYTPRVLTRKIVAKTLEPLLIDRKPLSLSVLDPSCGGGAFLMEVTRQLGAIVSGSLQISRLDAMRMVAVQCVYGADLQPSTVDAAKLCMWLLCRSSGYRMTWLDNSIKCGDALAGLDLDQIKQFHWKQKK